MSEETWEQKYEREDKIRKAKAKKAYALYKADKTKKLLSKRRDQHGKSWDYEYEDWVKETADVRRTKTTRFRVQDSGAIYMWVGTAKQQKFLVVNGPLAGWRITDENKDHVLYNVAGRYYEGKEPPRCVLVHWSTLA